MQSFREKGRPSLAGLGMQAKHEMGVIAHHCRAAVINCKAFGQLCQPVHDPFLAMLIALTVDGLRPSQTGSSHAA